MATLASLIRCPAAGRSLAGNRPRVLSCSVTNPFLPSRRTRISSSAARSPQAATSTRAWSTRSARMSVAAMDSSGRRGWTRPGKVPEPVMTRCRLSSGRRQAGLGFLRNGGKGRHVVHREIGQHLAIDREAGLVQAVDQRAVAHPAKAGRRIDARDPERAELALLLAPAAIGVLTGLDDRLLRRAEHLAPGIEVALRLLENLLVTPPGDHTAFDSCHVFSPDSLSVRQKHFDAVHVGLVDLCLAAQLAFTLGGLFRQDVTTMGLAALEAVRSFAKTLRRSPFGFQLGHARLLILLAFTQAPARTSPRICAARGGGTDLLACGSALFFC